MVARKASFSASVSRINQPAVFAASRRWRLPRIPQWRPAGTMPHMWTPYLDALFHEVITQPKLPSASYSLVTSGRLTWACCASDGRR